MATIFKKPTGRQEEENRNGKQKTKIQKSRLKPYYITTVTVNVNGLNTQMKRQKMGRLDEKHDPDVCCLQEIHFKYNDKSRLKVKG